MKNGLKIFAALSMVFSTMIGTNVAINHVAGQTVTQCGCNDASCRGGCALGRHRLKRPCRQCRGDCGSVECPSCENEICRLELDQSKVKKTCFKVEQKPICVPPVRFPWQKDCPPGTSKTKLIKVLSTHTYECPSCSYKWKLQECAPLEPAAPPQSEPTPADPAETSAIPAPPIFEVYRQPTPGNGAHSPVVVSAQR